MKIDRSQKVKQIKSWWMVPPVGNSPDLEWMQHSS
jgi:hypothetical protein